MSRPKRATDAPELRDPPGVARRAASGDFNSPGDGEVPQVGAPDPSLETSPIFDEDDAGELSLDQELESGACYFNGAAYPIGRVVMSGDEVLRCEGKGVWVRAGEARPAKRH